MIEFRCPECHRLLRVPEGSAGSQARCPACGEIVPVPETVVESPPPSPPPPANEFPTSPGDAFGSPTDSADIPARLEPELDIEPSSSERDVSGWAQDSPSSSEEPVDPFSGTRPSRPQSSPNPYASPVGDETHAPMGTAGVAWGQRDTRAYALDQVAAPAITMLVMACVMLPLQIIGNLIQLVGIMDEAGGQGPEVMVGVVGGGFAAVLGILVGITIIIGSLKMKRLESHGMAMTAAILSMIPCLSPCCIIGIPVGIWALVTLNDPNVRLAFTAQR